MGGDIVERLRRGVDTNSPPDVTDELMAIAAAEIERLRGLKTPATRKLLNITKGMLDNAEAENAKLVAEVARSQSGYSEASDVVEEQLDKIEALTAEKAKLRAALERIATNNYPELGPEDVARRALTHGVEG